MNKNHPYGCYDYYKDSALFFVTSAIIGTLIVGFLSIVVMITDDGPPLVALGCIGASGPIYAYEESDLPECTSIEEKD